MTAKTSFDTRAAEVTQVTANVILLDRLQLTPDAESAALHDKIRALSPRVLVLWLAVIR